jgi:hypothetical protein
VMKQVDVQEAQVSLVQQAALQGPMHRNGHRE